MMTLKKLALAAAVMALPFVAQADMKSLDDAALAGVTGQAGISISGNFDSTIGSIVYTDTETGATAGSNTLSLNSIQVTGFNISDNDPITVDVENNKLVIGLPAISGAVTVGSVGIGNTSIGAVAISDINMAGSTVKIWGH